VLSLFARASRKQGDEKARQFTSGHRGGRAFESLSLIRGGILHVLVMFDIKDRGHFAHRWLREVTRIRNHGEQACALIGVSGRKISFFFRGSMNSGPQTSLYQRPLFFGHARFRDVIYIVVLTELRDLKVILKNDRFQLGIIYMWKNVNRYA